MHCTGEPHTKLSQWTVLCGYATGSAFYSLQVTVATVRLQDMNAPSHSELYEKLIISVLLISNFGQIRKLFCVYECMCMSLNHLSFRLC